MSNNKDTTGWFTICVAVVLATVIFCVIIKLLFIDINAPEVIQRCPVGLCKFNVFTGVKTCPGNGETEGMRVAYGKEYCTSADYCQQKNYQCAVLSDQSLDCDGVCDTPECRCVAGTTSSLV